MPIRKVVADREWQALRRSLVGTWKRKPRANVAALRRYLDGRWDDPFALRRVLNYLTGSAFRIGIIAHPDVDKLRDEVRTIWRKG